MIVGKHERAHAVRTRVPGDSSARLQANNRRADRRRLLGADERKCGDRADAKCDSDYQGAFHSSNLFMGFSGAIILVFSSLLSFEKCVV